MDMEMLGVAWRSDAASSIEYHLPHGADDVLCQLRVLLSEGHKAAIALNIQHTGVCIV